MHPPLLILLTLLVILTVTPPTASRLLESHIDSSGLCHDVILNASSIYLDETNQDADRMASAYGLVFMLENTALTQSVQVTGLSIYLDGNAGVNYTVYVIHEEYLTVDEAGTRYSMLGGVLGEGTEVDDESGVDSVGWRRHGRGYIDENTVNYEGMAVITLETPIVMEGMDKKSVYIKLSAVDLCVMEQYDDGKALVPESVDETVVSGDGFDSLNILVGRAILLKSWASGLQQAIFDEFYPPRRFLGNIYMNVPSCTKTVRNSYFDLYSYGETQTRSNYYRVMNPFNTLHGNQEDSSWVDTFSSSVHNLFGTRRLQENTTTTGCFDTATVYPVVEGELQNFAKKKYGEILPQGVTVSDVKFTVKADREVWSSEGGTCQNVRFIVDEELVYSVEDQDFMTLGELAAAPFQSADSQAELLQKFKDYEPYFNRFGSMEGPKVTDPTLPTRMPSSRPSAAPSISSSPTTMPSETVSDRPSTIPSAFPSDLPSVSPSLYPSVYPSSSPSKAPIGKTEVPSAAPSGSPTVAIISILNTYVQFEYDIWYPPDRFSEQDIKGFIIGNVTNAFRDTLFNELPLLTFVNNFGLDLSTTQSPLVEVDSSATDVFCITDDLPENKDNICERFALSMPFRHFSTLTKENARFWILRVSDRSSGYLKSSYTGLKSVKSDQLLSFEDASGEPTPEEEEVMCDVLTDSLNSTLSSANYTITAVHCVDFEFIPYETTRKRMRLFPIGWISRRLQQRGVGNLNIYYNIEAEYPFRSGQVDLMADGFDNIIEDSINSGTVANAIKDDLVEREIAVVENAKVEAKTIETPAPTPYPTFEDAGRPDSTAFGNIGTVVTVSESSNTGTILAVVFSLVVLGSTLGMYVYYAKYMKFYPKDDDFSYEDSALEPSLMNEEDMYDRRMSMKSMKSLTPSALGDEPYDDEYDQRVRRKSLRYTDPISDDNSTSTAGSNDYSPTSPEKKIIDNLSMQRLQAFESRANNQDSSRINDSQRKMNISLEAFDARIRRRQEEMSSNKLNSFEDRIKRKLSKDNNDNRESTLHKSSNSTGSFDERLRAKMDSANNKSLHRSSHSIGSFDDRIKQKLARDGQNPTSGAGLRRNESTESFGSFEDRLKAKVCNEIPTDITFTSDAMKSSRSIVSVDSFEDRIKQKLARDGSAASSTAAQKTRKNAASMMEERINRKIAQNDATSAVPLKQSASISSMDSFEERIQRKLAREGANAPRNAPSPKVGVQRMTSVSAMEDRINRKLAQNETVPARQLKSTSSMSSLDSFEERIQRKLAREGANAPPNAPSQKVGAQHMTSVSVMEDRINRKLAQNKAVPTRKSKITVSMPGIDSYEDRIRQKLAASDGEAKNGVQRTSAGASESRTAQKISKDGAYSSRHVRSSSNSSFEDRLQKKLSQNAPSQASSSASSFEDRIQQKIAQDGGVGSSSSTQKPEFHSVGSLFESRIAQKVSRDGSAPRHMRSTSNASLSSVSSFEDRIQQKLAQNRAAGAPSSSSSAQKPGVQSASENTFESRMAQKISKDKAAASSHRRNPSSASVESFEDRIQKKLSRGGTGALSSSYAAKKPVVEKMDSLDSFEGRIQHKMRADTTYTRKSSADTMDALESNFGRQKSADSHQYDSYESRLQRKLQKSNRTASSNASVDSGHSASQASSLARSKRSLEGSPDSAKKTLDDKSEKTESSFKMRLKSHIEASKQTEIRSASQPLDSSSFTSRDSLDDSSGLEEKIKMKKAKSSANEKRGRRRHKSEKTQAV